MKAINAKLKLLFKIFEFEKNIVRFFFFSCCKKNVFFFSLFLLFFCLNYSPHQFSPRIIHYRIITNFWLATIPFILSNPNNLVTLIECRPFRNTNDMIEFSGKVFSLWILQITFSVKSATEWLLYLMKIELS